MDNLWMLGQSLINGITMGGIYALIAVGLSMFFGVMKVINFSQGECLMVGMYMTYMLQKFLGTEPYYLVIPVAAIMAMLGIAIFRFVIKRLLKGTKTNIMVATMGIAYILSTTMQIIFSANSLSVQSAWKDVTLTFGSFAVSLPRTIACCAMMVFVVAVSIFLNKSDVGRAMRATAENTEIAQMLGINTTNMFMLAFALGIAFAGIAGLQLSPTYFVNPTVGAPFKTIAMDCVVLGGLGNIGGAVVAGILAGIMEAVIGSYVSFDLAPAGIYMTLIIGLAIKPDGLFGKGVRKA